MYSGMDDLPQDVSDRINEVHRDANQSPGQIQQNLMKGTGDSAQLLNDDGFDGGLSYSNEALKSAIKSKVAGEYGRDIQKLNVSSKMEAVNRKFEKLKTAAELTSQEHQHNQQARMLRYQQRMRNKALRGQILGTVLGIGGAIGGAMIPGAGAAGAIAGSTLGQGLGNTLGGEGM
jgi:hypothetical protein